MIISYRHRYIFLHCRKVAGSAITAYLNRFLGPKDIQVGGWVDALSHGGSYNRRFAVDLFSLKGAKWLATPRLLKHWRMNPGVLNSAHKNVYRGRIGPDPAHARAVDVRAFDPVAWASHFKFCFVRNPYERAVSDYRYRARATKARVSFRQFLERIADPRQEDPDHIVPRSPTNWPIYTIDDRIAVDFVGRYERLEEDFATICGEIGVPFKRGDLPVARKTPGGYNYREWFGSEEKRLVECIFGNEIEHFGYRY